MKSVGVREFRDQATTLIASGETIVIERHGEPVGFFVPITAKDRPAGRAALGRLGDLLADITERAGLDEEAIAQEVAGRRHRR